jgi:probable rRNA maturation factor
LVKTISLELNIEINPAIAALTSIPEPDWQSWFHIWLNALTSKVEMTAKDYEVSLLLTDDQEIQTLNCQYRHQDRPTDVLAFAALEVDIPVSAELELNSEPVYLGDIIISVPTAVNQALEQGHSTKQELLWLAAHGLLHLLGWDHPDDESLEQMLAEQERLIQAISR